VIVALSTKVRMDINMWYRFTQRTETTTTQTPTFTTAIKLQHQQQLQSIKTRI